MIDSTFLLVAYDIENPREPAYAKRQYIEKREFKLLCDDIFCDVEVDKIKYRIIERRFFYVTLFERSTGIIIIDVEKRTV